MEAFNTLLSGCILPCILVFAGTVLGARLRFFHLLHPLSLIKELAGEKKNRISSLKALCQALAGTLGVGNMAGVATAICAGGPGAMLWMWVSALLCMSVKYFEVALAVKWRRYKKGGYYGGAMYYIRGIFSPFPRLASLLSLLFAVLCIANSLLSGNVIQIKAAAEVIPSVPPEAVSLVCAALAAPVIFRKSKAVSAVTSLLVPVLCTVYVALSLAVIIPRAARLPAVLLQILKGGLSLRAAGGGIGGFLLIRAIRFGTARGIFSNEAGSGTSPTAHAEADAKSPHAQGCFGIFEVFADTIFICTLTALVILLSDGCAKGYDGIALTVYAFSSQLGPISGLLVGACVILFAYATVICQARYGTVALQSITEKQPPLYCYLGLSLFCTAMAPYVCDTLTWDLQDTVVSFMTALNTLCILYAAYNGSLDGIFKKGS